MSFVSSSYTSKWLRKIVKMMRIMCWLLCCYMLFDSLRLTTVLICSNITYDQIDLSYRLHALNNQLSNIPSKPFNLKRNRPKNLRKQICNHREQDVHTGFKLLRANCQSKYQHCGESLQCYEEKNIQCDCNQL